jgi:hypothetical protein
MRYVSCINVLQLNSSIRQNIKVKLSLCLISQPLYHEDAYRILVGKPEGKIPLGRPRRRWEDNIRMDLREIGWGGMDLIDLA